MPAIVTLGRVLWSETQSSRDAIGYRLPLLQLLLLVVLLRIHVLLQLIAHELMRVVLLLSYDVVPSIEGEVTPLDELLVHLLQEHLIVMIDSLRGTPTWEKYVAWLPLLDFEPWVSDRRW